MSFSLLSRYLIKTYLEKFFLVLIIVSATLLISNIFDLLHRIRGIALGTVFIQLIFLKLPYLILEILPLIAMFSTFLMNYVMTKRNEIFIIWGSGISIFNALSPIILLNLFIGIFAVAILNPISTLLLVKYESIESKFTERKLPHLTLSSLGIIISENLDDQKRIYISKSVIVSERTMKQINILVTDKHNNFIERIDADTGVLKDKVIELRNARIFYKDGSRTNKESFSINTSIEISNLVESVTPPDHLSFWKLPDAINSLYAAGLPSNKHQLYYYKLLFKPLSMIAYVFFACCFMFKSIRSQNGLDILATGVFLGFTLYLISQVITNVLAYNDVNIISSVVIPILVIILLSNFAILHLRTD